jgi:hypothetical protein
VHALPSHRRPRQNEYYQTVVDNYSHANRTGGGWFCADLAGVCNSVVYDARARGGGGGGAGAGAGRRLHQGGGGGGGGPRQSLRQGHCGGKTDSPLYTHFKALAEGSNADFFSGFCTAVRASGLLGCQECGLNCMPASQLPTRHWSDQPAGLTNARVPVHPANLWLLPNALTLNHVPLLTPPPSPIHPPPSRPHPQYQAMSLIGYNVPATYSTDAAAFASLLTPITS